MGLVDLLTTEGRPSQELTGPAGSPIRNSADLAMLRRKAAQAMDQGDFELVDQYNAMIQELAKRMGASQEMPSTVGYGEGGGL